MRRALLAVSLCGLLAAAGCDGSPPASKAPRHSYALRIVDEAGAAVPSASVELVGRAPITVKDGAASISMNQPVAGVVAADGFLVEPIVLDPIDEGATVQLLATIGPSGERRRALQFGGDVMMGRRYQTGDGSTTAVAKNETDARAIVSSVAPLMAAADVSMVNLETVVGDLAPLDAYPGKRFLLQSPPFVLDALDEMGIDFVSLGNNHAYDWRDDGVASTIGHLDEVGIAWAGAGRTAEEAQNGRLLEVAGMKVGVVSSTTVNGDFVNDNLPTAAEAQPASIVDGEQWQYEARPCGFGHQGDAAFVPAANRLAGDMWKLYESIEQAVDDASAAALWARIVQVYPELQDWVARRGHGGAAPFDSSVIQRQVQALRAAGAALVVVQIHGGLQFSDVPTDFYRTATHAAIDAGADLVIGHHPHVVQGFEFYKGHLIAYSLGNFVFDQDFLSTFPSVILRTVYEGTHLLVTRVIPIALEKYRPVPITGEAMQHVLRLLDARSVAPASSERIALDLTGNVISSTVQGNAIVRRDGSTARLYETVQPSTDRRSLVRDEITDVGACTLVRSHGTAPGVWVGTDLLGWGTLDDASADGVNAGAAFWTLGGGASLRYAKGHESYIHLESTAHSSADTRQVARSNIPVHRWFDSKGRPIDGTPEYSLQVDIRRSDARPRLKLVLFDVNDSDPTVEPSSTQLHEATIDFPLTPVGEWTTVEIDLTDLLNAEFDGVRAEAIFAYVVAPAGDNRVDVDSLRLFEWRQIDELPPNAWVQADALRSVTGTDVQLDSLTCD